MKLFKLIPILMLMLTSNAFSDIFSSQVRLTFNNVIANDNKLVFGAHTNATDGKDTDFGELYIPPMPPPEFDLFVVFNWDTLDVSGKWSYIDMRSVPEVDSLFNHRYKIVLFKQITSIVTISWDNLPVNIKSAKMTDKLGGILFSADMKTQNSVTINNTTLEKIDIILDVVYDKRQVSVKEESSKSYVYPNPSMNHIFLTNIEDVENVEIYNQLGEKVFNTNSIIDNSIDVSSLLKGIYYIQIIKRDNSIIRDKFIKIDN